MVESIGLLGGGQLGKMFAQAATRLGFEVVVFSPEPNCPAAQASTEHICAEYTDTEALREFATKVQVVTYEFENIPVTAFESLEPFCSGLSPKRSPAGLSEQTPRKGIFFFAWNSGGALLADRDRE